MFVCPPSYPYASAELTVFYLMMLDEWNVVAHLEILPSASKAAPLFSIFAAISASQQNVTSPAAEVISTILHVTLVALYNNLDK